jgi:hypothetical protein
MAWRDIYGLEQKNPVGTWQSVIKVHPAADLFPMMGPDELKVLAEDIRLNGVQNPIATWFDKDEQEWLIDGRNRLEALQRLGYKFSRVEHNASGVCTATKLKIRNPNARKDATGQDATSLDTELSATFGRRVASALCGARSGLASGGSPRVRTTDRPKRRSGRDAAAQ